MAKCITCPKQVITQDPFESGRCEDCFDEFMKRPTNKTLTHATYWYEEQSARNWYGKSADDKLREAVA